MTLNTFSLNYTEPMVRDAVRTFVLRRGIQEQKGFWLTAALMICGFIYLLSIGDRSWLLGLVGTASLLPLIMAAAMWRIHFVNTVGKLRRMAQPQASMTIEDTGLTFTTDLGTGNISWRSITDTWEKPSYWIIFTGPAQFNILPTDNLPAETQRWLRNKIRPHAGGAVS